MFEVLSACRSCGSDDLEPFLSLGELPAADALRDPLRLYAEEPRYPLDVGMCRRCSLVQLLGTVDPTTLFDENYLYFSSFSDELVAHARQNAERLIEACGLGPDSLVVEPASNDGYLLRNFVEHGIPVLGFDPAHGPAAAAEAAGIPTVRAFFGVEQASRLRASGRRADALIANNVLAHVPDLNGFVAGIATVLADDGLALIEVPYVRDLIDRCEFDTIYHEHLCYFSVSSLAPLFARHGLGLTRVEHIPIHGGSLRLLVGRDRPADETVDRYLHREAACGLLSPDYVREFAARVRAIQSRLVETLSEITDGGGRVAGYGAAAKGSILLNSSGIGPDLVEYVVDRNVHKQGRYMPGVDIPIRDPEVLLTDRPDFTLLLSWNFRDEVLRQQAEYRAGGGRFIVPIPTLEIV